MPRSKQVLKMDVNGRKYSVVYRELCDTPYWVYRHSWALRECGYGMSERKRLEGRYADFKSCMIYLTSVV